MSELLARHFVRAPYNLAQGYLAKLVGSHVSAPRTLDLTLDVPGGELVKQVKVTYESGVDPMHFDAPWRVRWEPQAGPYPVFEGELTVRADENYETSLLELRGSYTPPGGIAGAAFDEVLGKHIAQGTAKALLERIGAELELRYAQSEKSKASSS